jgi:predicted Zn-dependent protease
MHCRGIYVYLGDAALAMKDEARAWEALDKARSLDPLSVSVLTSVAQAAMRTKRPDVAAEAIATLEQLQPEVASEQRVLELIWNDELARFVLQLEKHRETYPGSRAFSYRLAEAGREQQSERMRTGRPSTRSCVALSIRSNTPTVVPP